MLGAMTVTEANQPRTEVHDEMTRLHHAIERLESTCSALRARLGPVIRPVPVCDMKDDGPTTAIQRTCPPCGLRTASTACSTWSQVLEALAI